MNLENCIQCIHGFTFLPFYLLYQDVRHGTSILAKHYKGSKAYELMHSSANSSSISCSDVMHIVYRNNYFIDPVSSLLCEMLRTVRLSV